MNKLAVLQTAILKMEDGVYVYESSLLPNCIGAADTKKEAWNHFVHHVETAYAAYLEGRLAGMYDRPGRPAKNTTQVTLRVHPETRTGIASLAKVIQCSQGEIADFLFSFWEAGHTSLPERAAAKTNTRKTATRKVQAKSSRGTRSTRAM